MQIEIPPGFFNNGTRTQTAGRWNDGNLVRWIDNTLKPIKGWVEVKLLNPPATYANIMKDGGTDYINPRSVFTWNDKSGNDWIVLGTHKNVFVIAQDKTVYDITPDNFVGGEAYEKLNIAYGGGYYGVETYGTIRQFSESILSATLWSFTQEENKLLAICIQRESNKIYSWTVGTPGSQSKLIAIEESPKCRAIFKTEEEYLFAIRTSASANEVQWADRRNTSKERWNITPISDAGSALLQSNGLLMRGIALRGQSLILSSEEAFGVNYTGGAFIFSFQKLGSGCGLIAYNAIAIAMNSAYWWSKNKFMQYREGMLQELNCSVLDYVMDNFNQAKPSVVSAFYNQEHSEIWWLYPSKGSLDPDRYLAYNIVNQTWLVGSLDRIAGCSNTEGLFMFDKEGRMFRHEIAYQYDDNHRPFAQASAIPIAQYEQVTHIKAIYPDIDPDSSLVMSFTTRREPTGKSTYQKDIDLTPKTDLRLVGRELDIRVEQASDVLETEEGELFIDELNNTLVVNENYAEDWKLGKIILSGTAGGMR